MTHLRLFFLLILAYSGNSEILKTRGVVNFGQMIYLKTGRNPTIFRSYGNYCGFGGKGVAVDAIDKCCEIHDNCYAEVAKNECPHSIFQLPTGYEYKIHDGNITCIGGTFITNFLGLNACAQALCMCDKVATECFAEHLSVYNQTHKGVLPQILKGK